MRLPTIQGIIKRRILVNFRAEPTVIQRILPQCFRTKLHKGLAIAGICLIRLEQMRPRCAPEFVGLRSENAAHRIGVMWEDADTGETREGVYINRRDTDSFINATVGGTLFPGKHYKAHFDIQETESEINFAMQSNDRKVSVEIKGKVEDTLPETSVFSSLAEASKFFEAGSLGYSVTHDAHSLDGVSLQTKEWKVAPLEISFVHSSFYDDENIFPKGSIKFDHALVMRNITHEWHGAPSFELN
jgi:hypothetical protein